MNDFWGSATGDETKAFLSGFTPIPDGTEATAELKKAVLDESQGREPSYNFQWKILAGPYAGRIIFQRIKCFDPDENKAYRAKEMLLLIYHIFGVSPPLNAPTDHDLLSIVGGIASIKIGHWMMDGKEGNIVREIHKDVGAPDVIDSAMSRNGRVANGVVGDQDIPF